MKPSCVLLGHPIRHSVSPAIHAAAYRELGLAYRYEAVDVATAADLTRHVAALRAGELAFVNITIPWKRLALQLSDRVDPSAGRTGAANTLLRDAEGNIVAYNTDAIALEEEIRLWAPRASRAVVIGSGGAGLAAVVACRDAGVDQVAVTARRWLLGVSPWPCQDEFVAHDVTLLAWPKSVSVAIQFWEEWFLGVDLIIQATSAGMLGADSGDEIAQLVPWDCLASRTHVFDLVYNPPQTPILQAARAAGYTAENGLGVLVRQAARAIALWSGHTPQITQLRAAAEAALTQFAVQ